MAMITVKWDNVNLVMQHNFYQYLCEGNFFDCTLSCEEKFIPAHRIVLSAASKYFEKMFKMCAERQMVVLQNVDYDDLIAVVKFVYTGEAKICTENYEGFMRTAKVLQIKGLNHDGPTPQQDEPPILGTAENLDVTLQNTLTGTAGASAKSKQPQKQISRKNITLPTSSRKENAANSPNVSTARSSNMKPIEVKPEAAPQAPHERRKQNKRSLVEINTAESEDSEDEKQLEIKVFASQKVNKKSSPPKETCPFCLKVYTANWIRRHVCKGNPKIMRQCPICQKQLTRTDNFTQHVASHSKTSKAELE